MKWSHRLVYVGGKQGEWVPYDEAACLDEFAAVTEKHQHNLPFVFSVTPILDYVTHYFDHDSDDYWMKSKEKE